MFKLVIVAPWPIVAGTTNHRNILSYYVITGKYASSYTGTYAPCILTTYTNQGLLISILFRACLPSPMAHFNN